MQVKAGQEVLRELSEGLLRSTCRVGRHSHTLEIHHGFAPELDPALLHSRSEAFGVSLSINQGREALTGRRLHCDTSLLPFQDGVFSMVVLHHVLEEGNEPELSEAARVLARDGVLVILGLNRFGWRYQSQGKFRALPGFSPLKVRARFEPLNLQLTGIAGAGLFKRQRPVLMTRGLSGVGLPIADVILMVAGHKHGPVVTPLRFRKLSSGVVQSASLSG